MSKAEISQNEKYNKLAEKFNKKCVEAEEGLWYEREAGKLSKRVSKLKLKIGQLEDKNRELKAQVKQKEDEIETERIARKRAVILEKRKAKEKVKEKVDRISVLEKEVDKKKQEIFGLKRDNLYLSGSKNNSRFFSPKTRRAIEGSEKRFVSGQKSVRNLHRRHGSPSNFSINHNLEENDSQIISEKTTTRGHKKMKSSSPNRDGIDLSEKKVHIVANINTQSSKRKLRSVHSEVNMYDDTHKHSHGKYCEACKYKKWRVEQIKYDPQKLLYNRDIIKYITCLGWERAFEVKLFIKHARDCRLSNHVPHLDGNKYYKSANKTVRHLSSNPSSNPKSKNRSERMDSVNGDISNIHRNRGMSRNQFMTPTNMLIKTPAHTQSSDNLNPVTSRRLKSCDKLNTTVYEMGSDSDMYNSILKPDENWVDSMDDENSDIISNNCKVYNFDVKDIDEESENVNDDNEELTAKGKGSMGHYMSKIHSFSNMFQNNNNHHVSKREFEELKHEVAKLYRRQEDFVDSFHHEDTNQQRTETQGSLEIVNRESYARPLIEVDPIKNSAVGFTMSKARNKMNIK